MWYCHSNLRRTPAGILASLSLKILFIFSSSLLFTPNFWSTFLFHSESFPALKRFQGRGALWNMSYIMRYNILNTWIAGLSVPRQMTGSTSRLTPIHLNRADFGPRGHHEIQARVVANCWKHTKSILACLNFVANAAAAGVELLVMTSKSARAKFSPLPT